MKPHSPKLGTCAWYGVVAQAGRLDVVTTVQKLLPRDQRRGRLHDRVAARRQVLLDQLVEACACRACRSRSWSGRESRRRSRRTSSSCCSSQAKASALTIATFGERSASPFSARSSGVVENSCVMCGSSSTSVTLLDARVPEDLAHRHAVAAAEHEHALAARRARPSPDAPAPRGSGTRRASGTAGCR